MECGKTEDAKPILVTYLRHAMLSGSTPIIFLCNRGLAFLYSQLGDFEPASKHAIKAMSTFRQRATAGAPWPLETSCYLKLMFMKFAIIFVRVKRWDLVVSAFAHIIKGESSELTKVPLEVTALESPEELLSLKSPGIGYGFVLLASSPYYLLSSTETEDLWLQYKAWAVGIVQKRWHEFDEASVFPIKFISPVPNPGRDQTIFHASLDKWLRPYQSRSQPDGKEFSSLEQLERNLESAFLSTVDVVVAITLRSQNIPGSKNEVPPALNFSETLSLASHRLSEEATSVQLNIPPVVTWGRMIVTIQTLVQDSLPLNDTAICSKLILQLLEGLYLDSGDITRISAPDVATILETILNNSNEEENRDRFGDREEMKNNRDGVIIYEDFNTENSKQAGQKILAIVFPNTFSQETDF